VIVTLAGVGSYLQSSRLVIPDQLPVPAPVNAPARARVAGLWRLIVSNRPFVRFELRSLVYVAAIGLSLPVLPLFYVIEVHAPDAWIGAIGASASVGSVLGYLVARQIARRGSASRILLPSLLGAALAPALLAVTSWLPAVAAIMFVAGIAGAGAQLALFDQLMRRIPAELGVTYSAVDQTLANLAFVIAPNLGGFLVIALGARVALLIVAALGTAAFALFWLGTRTSRAAAPRTIQAA
jgi:predicted MFS family arabinose efflux permease